MKKLVFPDHFLWGAATSSHQVEGDNRNSDWWRWEQAGGGAEPSGRACGHYELYEKDFDLAAALGHNCHRFSIEWSRIQPDEHTFSEKEIGHYRDVIAALKTRGLEPIVTLHHFTSPVWFADKGGWTSPRAVTYFTKYAAAMVKALGDNVKYWVTINEPLVLLYYGYVRGFWPPNTRSLFASRAAHRNFINAHIAAYRLIHCHYAANKLARPSVGFAHNMVDFVPCRDNPLDRFVAMLRGKLYNTNIIDELIAKRALDYIGLNYYTRHLIHARGCAFNELIVETCRDRHDNLEKNCMGWEIYPQGILDILRRLGRYRLPVLILENGICVSDDKQRWRFISDHLEKVHQAITEGVRVEGYCYWSLMDNFEWDKGFAPRFGLVDVNYATLERTARESAVKFSRVCGTGILEVER